MNMFTRWPVSLPVCVVALACLSTEASAAENKRWVVVPFAALSSDVPPRAGTKAAGMLGSELKNAGGQTVAELPAAAATTADDASLKGPRALVDEAKKARDARKFKVAEEKLSSALDAYRAQASALTDIGEVQDAQALLAAVQFLTGKDEEGRKSLSSALSLAPNRALPLAQTSPLFSRVVEENRAALKGTAKETVLVESQPAGAEVLLDGVRVGRTPVEIAGVPAGPHWWKLTYPTGLVSAGFATVNAGKGTTKVSGKIEASTAEARLLAALGGNRLDESALSAAKEIGKTAGAQALLVGTLGPHPQGLVLEPFSVDVGTGAVQRLPAQTFDAELLGAGAALAGLVESMTKGTGEAVKLPAPAAKVAFLQKPSLTQVKYGIAAKAPGKAVVTGDDDDAGQNDAPAPTTQEAPKRRVPLRKK